MRIFRKKPLFFVTLFVLISGYGFFWTSMRSFLENTTQKAIAETTTSQPALKKFIGSAKVTGFLWGWTIEVPITIDKETTLITLHTTPFQFLSGKAVTRIALDIFSVQVEGVSHLHFSPWDILWSKETPANLLKKMDGDTTVTAFLEQDEPLVTLSSKGTHDKEGRKENNHITIMPDFWSDALPYFGVASFSLEHPLDISITATTKDHPDMMDAHIRCAFSGQEPLQVAVSYRKEEGGDNTTLTFTGVSFFDRLHSEIPEPMKTFVGLLTTAMRLIARTSDANVWEMHFFLTKEQELLINKMPLDHFSKVFESLFGKKEEESEEESENE